MKDIVTGGQTDPKLTLVIGVGMGYFRAFVVEHEHASWQRPLGAR